VPRWSVPAHTGFVRGVAFSPDGQSLWTCGDDKVIKMWDRNPSLGQQTAPLHTILGQHAFMAIDHHWSEPLLATCGVDIQIWDHERSEPVTTLSWGSESIQSVRFNPVERHVLASTGDEATSDHTPRTASACCGRLSLDILSCGRCHFVLSPGVPLWSYATLSFPSTALWSRCDVLVSGACSLGQEHRAA